MIRQRQSWLASLVGVSAGLIAVQVSCREADTAVSPKTGPILSVTDAGGVVTHFAADVEVTMPALIAKGDSQLPVPKLTYHIDQVRDTVGWRTTYTEIARPSARVADVPTRAPVVTRIEVDGSGHADFYNALGKRLDPDSFKTAENLKNKVTADPHYQARWQQFETLRTQSAAHAQYAATPQSTRDVPDLVVDPVRGRAALAKLRTHAEQISTQGALQRYSVQVSRGVIEIVVDSARGLLVEVDRHPTTGPETHIVYEYAPTTGGRYVRTLMRREHIADDKTRGIVSETRLYNVRLDTSEGQ